MKIKSIGIYQSPIELKEPFITSLGPDTHAENVVVIIHTDEYITGWGECNPYMPICGESMETAFAVGQYIAKILVGKDPLLIAEHHAAFDRLIYQNNSIKSAFDIALHDIAAQHAGAPLYSFLGGKKDKPLVIDYTISLDTEDKMAGNAKKIIADGFTVIKVKLGESRERDVARIKAIRTAIGNDIPLRIDANGGWSAETAIEILRELAPYHIQYCEEPIARWDYTSLPQVRKKSPIPLMGDESCCDHHDARRLIDLQACDMFNIKLGKSAGIYKAMKIAKLAERAGMLMQVGGFLESRLGFTASAHFALANKNIRYYDWDTPLMFTEDPVIGGIMYGRGGGITVPDAPGLGATMDMNYLQQCKSVIIE